MTETQDLIARLRVRGVFDPGHIDNEAADALEALQAEIDRLKCVQLARFEALAAYTVVLEAERDAALARIAEIEAQEPVASIYISAFGGREMDDWKCELPQGRNELFAAAGASPQPSQARELSSDEIQAIWVEHGIDECDPETFARAIIAAINAKEPRT